MSYSPEDVLTLTEVAKKLRLDPRTVKRIASALGGKRFGNRWRFKWGTVMEYFSNANLENGQRQSMDGGVVVDGKQIGCKMFPPGRKHGPEWRAAKEWEEQQRKLAQAGQLPQQEERKPSTPTACERLLAWGELYLAHAERTMTRSTWVEKQTHMRAFFAFCRETLVEGIESIGKPQVYAFLSLIRDERGAKAANEYRKNLLAAWNWGVECVEGFPQVIAPSRVSNPSLRFKMTVMCLRKQMWSRCCNRPKAKTWCSCSLCTLLEADEERFFDSLGIVMSGWTPATAYAKFA